MSIVLDFPIDFGSSEVHKFLATFKVVKRVDRSGTHYDYEIERGEDSYTTPSELDEDLYESIDSRSNSFSSNESIEFPVTEVWVTRDKGGLIGKSRLVSVFSQAYEISVSYEVFSQNYKPSDLTKIQWEAAKDLAKQLLHEYDPNTHGNDINNWVGSRIAGTDLKEGQVEFVTRFTLKKSYAPSEHNTDAREAFLDMISKKPANPRNVEILLRLGNDDEGLDWSSWVRENGINAEFVSVEEYYQSEPIQTDLNNEGFVSDIIGDYLVKATGDGPCKIGKNTEEKRIHLLRLSKWPEIKVEWRRKKIKVGCSTITIKYPVFWKRESRLEYYVFWAIPKDVLYTAKIIAESCAKRSALKAAVLGLVLMNFAAALSAFVANFKSCVIEDIKSCVFPGIACEKRPTNWERI